VYAKPTASLSLVATGTRKLDSVIAADDLRLGRRGTTVKHSSGQRGRTGFRSVSACCSVCARRENAGTTKELRITATSTRIDREATEAIPRELYYRLAGVNLRCLVREPSRYREFFELLPGSFAAKIAAESRSWRRGDGDSARYDVGPEISVNSGNLRERLGTWRQ